MLLAVTTQSPPSIRSVRAEAPEASTHRRTRPRKRSHGGPFQTRLRPRSAAADAVADGHDGCGFGPAIDAKCVVAIAAVALLAAAVPGVWFIRQNGRTRGPREGAAPDRPAREAEQFAQRSSWRSSEALYPQRSGVEADDTLSRESHRRDDARGGGGLYGRWARNAGWTSFGASPIADAVVPNAYLEWRFEKRVRHASDATAFILGLPPDRCW